MKFSDLKVGMFFTYKFGVTRCLKVSETEYFSFSGQKIMPVIRDDAVVIPEALPFGELSPGDYFLLDNTLHFCVEGGAVNLARAVVYNVDCDALVNLVEVKIEIQ